MKAHEFCYWLQGFFEIYDAACEGAPALNCEQAALVQKHLALVFKHEIDAKYGDNKHQAELNEIHEGTGGIADTEAVYNPPNPPSSGPSGGPTVFRC